MALPGGSSTPEPRRRSVATTRPRISRWFRVVRSTHQTPRAPALVFGDVTHHRIREEGQPPLSLPPREGWTRLRFFGKYSYGLYVFHVPITRLVAVHWKLSFWQLAHFRGFVFVGFVATSMLSFAITQVLALVSWSLLEAPLSKLRRHFVGRNVHS